MQKSITDGHIIMEPESMNRAIFIINVVDYHIKKNDFKKNFFFICKRPWLEIIKEYGRKNNLEIFDFYNLPDDINNVWVICYERFTGPTCEFPENKSANFKLIDSIKFYLVEAKLIQVNKL